MTIKGFTSRRELVKRLEKLKKTGDHTPVRVNLSGGKKYIEIYPASLRSSSKGGIFVAGCYRRRSVLFILGKASLRVMEQYQGKVISRHSDFVIKKCRITRSVARQLRSDFPFCAPSVKTDENISIAFGDVLGMGAKAQILAFSGKSDLTFSRQCLHQLRKLEFLPEDALDSITWSVFQEGYENGYSAEACQLVNSRDIGVMVDAGFTRLSIEPAESDLFAFREESKRNLLEQMFDLPWIKLRDKFELMFNRYKERRIDVGVPDLSLSEENQEPLVIFPSEKEVLAAIRMFTRTLAQIVEMEKVLTMKKCREDVILEVSFAGTRETLTPFEHYFLMTELMRHDIHPDYLAPGQVTREHKLVARHVGQYGLTAPAGYIENVQRESSYLKQHVIYPDISYITALKCILLNKPDLFRKIWKTARNHFEEIRKESQTGVKIQNIPSADEYDDRSLPELLHNKHTEEFLKVTMGIIMTARDKNGHRHLRQQLFDFLHRYETTYTEALLETYKSWAAEWNDDNIGKNDGSKWVKEAGRVDSE